MKRCQICKYNFINSMVLKIEKFGYVCMDCFDSIDCVKIEEIGREANKLKHEVFKGETYAEAA